MSILVLDHHGIGDVVISLPLLDSLRRGFPDEAIDVIVKSPVEAAIVGTTGVRRCITFHRETMGVLQRMIFAVRLIGRYRLMVATVNTNPRLANWLGRTILARKRIGIGSERGPFTLNVPTRKAHKVDDNLEIAGHLGISVMDRAPVLRLPASVTAAAARPATAKPVVAIHLTTGMLVGPRRFDTSIAQFKELPLGFWAGMLAEAQEKLGPIAWISVGGSREGSLLKALRRHLSQQIELHDYAGRLSILETAALIASARVFVGGDSGLAHVAAAVGTPVVAMFGPTNPGVTAPVGRNVNIVSTTSCPLAPCYPDRIYACRWGSPDEISEERRETRMCMNRFAPSEAVQRLAPYLTGPSSAGRAAAEQRT